MKTSRRDFLKGASVASLWAAGGCAGFPAITSVRSPNALLNHACIGTGNMANYDMYQFLENGNVHIAALCDVDAEYLAKAGKAVKGARLYRDWRELLEKEGDRIDSVNVSTPDHTHACIISAALCAGKHVYSQKPLCKYFDENARLAQLAAESGKVTQLGTQCAAFRTDRTCVALLRSGVLGPVRNLRLYSNRTGRSRAERTVPVPCAVPAKLDWNLWLGPAAERPYAEGYHPLLWRMYADFGTGWIGDLCIHVISAPWQGLNLGEAAPISVRADVNAEALVNPAYKGCWPRYSHIVWEMPGVRASGMKPFRMEWLSGFANDPSVPKEFLPEKGVFKEIPLQGRIIETELAWVVVDHCYDETSGIQIVMKDGSTPPPLPELGPAPSHFDDFVDKCIQGGTPRSSFAWASKMMDAVLMGGIAERLPGRTHRWNAATRTFDNPDANRLARSNYRAGWKLA